MKERIRTEGRVGADAWRQSASIFTTLGDTIRDIVESVQQIIRSEVELAKSEVRQQARAAAKAAALYTVCAVCALFAIDFILLGSVYALSIWVSPWLAAMIVGVGMAGIAAGALLLARKESRRISLRAEHTIETAKENIQWAKNRFK